MGRQEEKKLGTHRKEVIPLEIAVGTEPQFYDDPDQSEDSMDLTWDPQFYINN